MVSLKKVDRVSLTPPNVFSWKKLTLNLANLFEDTEGCGPKVNKGVANV